jgi:hypothetical protein
MILNVAREGGAFGSPFPGYIFRKLMGLGGRGRATYKKPLAPSPNSYFKKSFSSPRPRSLAR